MVETKIENKLTVKTLATVAGIVFTLLSAIAGAFVYIDGKYVDQDIYDIHVTQQEKDYEDLDEKTAQLFIAVQTANNTELNKIRQEIKAASALPLIVRRDVLLSRGGARTNNESAELEIIRAKLTDLNMN
jgi:D-serine deaminase-like pyridoxal phosphate-dependent protein